MISEFFPKKSAETIIRDPEKAREMAEIEDHYRELAIAFREYMEDPAAYTASEKERVSEMAAEGSFSSEDTADYMELYRAGVRPGDLEALGEQMAELHAREYDFAQEVKTKPDLALRAVIAWLKLEQRFYQHVFDKQISQADLSNVEGRSYVALHLLNQLGAGDPHASLAEKIHQWLGQSERMWCMAEEELRQRKGGGTDKIAA
ncbi:MAG TPA: hypothetical protein VMF32_04160 [Xanthobacteraceae bacterium]|nr:hypothetical protein [Xanthobacteraceae bacterium]